MEGLTPALAARLDRVENHVALEIARLETKIDRVRLLDKALIQLVNQIHTTDNDISLLKRQVYALVGTMIDE